MKDIDITNTRNKILYYTSVIGYFLLILTYGGFLMWIVFAIIYSVTKNKKPKQQGLLNLPYQKFVFVVGNISFFIIVPLVLLLQGLWFVGLFYPAVIVN